MTNYKAIIKDGLILMAISTVFALVFKVGFDQLRGDVEDDPLITASLQDNIDMMETVLSEESFKKNPEGKSTYEEFTKFMTNKQDEQKRTPLMWVSYMNYSDRETIKKKEEKRLLAAKLLVEKGADVNLKDEHGWTALSWASWTGLPTLVSFLLENAQDVNLADRKGLTPLMLASQRSNHGVVKVLLAKGADKDLKNNEGKTALDLAEHSLEMYPELSERYKKTIDLLENGIKEEVKEKVPETAGKANINPAVKFEEKPVKTGEEEKKEDAAPVEEKK